MKSIKLSKIVIFLYFIVPLLNGCSSLQTHLTTSINHYQDGETIGKDKSKTGLALGAGQLIKTNVTIEMVGDDNSSINYIIETEKSKMLVINSFFQFGLIDKMDFIVEAYISLVGYGGRCNLKYKINNLDSNFGISIMPGIGYSRGLTSRNRSSGNFILIPGWFTEDFSLSSNAISLELNLPASYKISEDLAFHFGLHLSKYIYNVSSSYVLSDPYNTFSESKDFSNIYFNPGISIGLRINNLYPEVRIDYADKDYIVYYGIGLKFNKK